MFVFYLFQVSDILLLKISTFLFSSALSFALKKQTTTTTTKKNKFLPRPHKKKKKNSIWGIYCVILFFKFFLKLFIFGCAGPWLLCRLFLQLRHAGFSLQRLLLLWSMSSRSHTAFRSGCGSQTLEHRLHNCGAQA